MQSTPSSRRTILFGAGAATAAVVTAAAVPAGEASPDPILAVIERHRTAVRDFVTSVAVAEDFAEDEEVDRTSKARGFAEQALIEIMPSTALGTAALMRYVSHVEATTTYEPWPDETDDVDQSLWMKALHRNRRGRARGHCCADGGWQHEQSKGRRRAPAGHSGEQKSCREVL
jgi:hypothetical protein